MELERGYKHTEIGTIPEDWKVNTLKNLTSLMTNGFVGTAKTHYVNSSEGVLYIQGYNVKENSFNFNGIKRVDKEFHKKNSKSNLREGDLLTVQTGDVGLTTIIPKELEGANCHALIITRFKKYKGYSKFFAYYLNSFIGRERLREIETGTTMKHINVGDMIHFQVPLPPTIEEQQAIAQVLTDTDQLIQNLKTLIAKKKAIKQGAMQELLTPKKNWKTNSLFELAENKKGLFDDGDWIEAEHITNKGIRLVQTGNIGIGSFNNKKSKKYIYENSFEKLKCKELIQGDILICRLAEPAGRACIFPKIDDTKTITSVDVTIFRPSKKMVNRVFLVNIFTTNEWFKTVNESVGGTTHKRISRGALGKIKIQLPSLGEQNRVAQILSDMDAEIEGLEQQLQKTQALKQGMMQELLTGKTRLVKPARQEETKPLAMVAEPKSTYIKDTKPKKHNEYINDAVLIGIMANAFGSDKFPLTRFMYTKVSYLLKRYKEEQDTGYLKKAAGPYKPKTRYGGAEKIALQNQYVKTHISSYKGTKYENFIAGDNVTEAINYFKDWYGETALQWIQQFKYTKRDQLELWATVDMAMEDLKQDNKPVSFATIKELINNHKEWRPKLKRPVFSDNNIKTAINKINQLFG